jgi:hypothetical protein
MNDQNDWGESDWGWPYPVIFKDTAFQSGSIAKFILLGGLALGLISAIWYTLY